MNHLFGKFLTALALIAAIFVTGCAPMTEMQREAREYSHAEFMNRFFEDREQCLANGRQIVVMTYGGGVDRHGFPKTRTPYYCT